VSHPDDRDLSTAFEELSAPSSTANYATRTPSLEVHAGGRRWPQVLATALAVLVAVGGAGTFLALRSARQGGEPASAHGNPPARQGAAMAYDSTAGLTVMFGGTGGSGRPLSDTWTWDGSGWTAAARGPAALVDVHMVDDPAAAGVLLVGQPVLASSGGGVAGSGCAIGASANPGSSAGTPGAVTGAPGLTPVRPTGPPLSDPVPTAIPAPSSAPVPACSPPAVLPPVSASSVQTWVFHNGAWTRAASAAAPPADALLAFDPTTRQVVAVSPGGVFCGAPIEGGVKTGPAIACPLVATPNTTGAVASLAPCPGVEGCSPIGVISTWTWSGGHWRTAPATASQPPQQVGLNLLFTDPASRHVTLMTQSNAGLYGNTFDIACVKGQSCPVEATPQVTTWSWSGSGWVQVSRVTNRAQVPPLYGASEASIDGTVVAVTDAGQTWTWAAGQWTQDTVTAQPTARNGAAMAQGPSGSLVLFGGVLTSAYQLASSSVGADTWVWNGSTWRHAGGTEPIAQSPSACPALGGGVIPPCVQPLPAEVPPATPVASDLPAAVPSSPSAS
jgi:hypothetical protein